jgi:UDP:flavonoid glycosyltransferase YjiC (YdhE family)
LPRSASTAEIRAALERLLGEASFGAAARRLGDALAAEARASTLVEDLEALSAASRSPQRSRLRRDRA